jgi:8-oxo-dGTP diphosphatase
MGEAEFSVAAYAVIQDESGRVLLTRRRESDDWILPGGTVEEAEAPWEALEREVEEETGLEVEVERLSGVYAKRHEHDLVFVFIAGKEGGQLRASDERDRVEFVDSGDLPAGTTAKEQERIRDALSGDPNPVLRVQPSEGDQPPAGTR